MPDITTIVALEEPGEEKQDVPVSKAIIGIIHPPPEVRNIVDKSAAFVARNGPEFEARIRQNEINNPKFNFLNSGDPYHSYYQHKVKEYREGKTDKPEPTPTQPTQKQSAETKTKVSEILKSVEIPIIPKEPPPEYEYTADPPSISAFDLDIVKLTAQFIARNGRQFLMTLMNREQRNYQFDFLKPQHSLFSYFMKLLEQYTKILVPPKDTLNKLKKESEDTKAILDQIRYRVEWTKLQDAQRRREEEEAERERVAYAQIDWHDFLVVEVVDYQPNEQGHFPPPTNPEEVGSRVLQQERYEEMGQDEMEVESSDSDDETSRKNKSKNAQKKKKTAGKAQEATNTVNMPSSPSSPSDSDDESGKKRPPSPPPIPPPEVIPQPPLILDYNPKAVKPSPAADEYLVSPLTGERIHVSKMAEHMRIGLLDPRWVEQRDRMMQEKAEQDEVYAHGSAIESSLKELAQRRTDIFGTEETVIGKKIGEEDQRPAEKVTWDGHTASMEAATRAARANITLEEQIHQIHKVKGLLPDEEKERIGPSKPLLSSGVIAKAPPLPPAPPKAPPPPPSSVQRPPMPPQQQVQMPPMPHPLGMMMVTPRGPMPGMGMMPMGGMPPPPGTPFQQMPPGAMHASPGGPPPQYRPSMSQDDDDYPPTKKAKTEDSLIPEDEFLSKNKGPVMFKVVCPKAMEKAEWKLAGQTLSLTLPLTDSISVIKAKVHDQTGMPPGKQKLQYEGMFVKDSNSLAFYNFTPNSVVLLQMKERGGRKK